MEEGGKFESIEKGGSVKGPQKCELPPTARTPDLCSAAALCVQRAGQNRSPRGPTRAPTAHGHPTLGPKHRLATHALCVPWQPWRGG